VNGVEDGLQEWRHLQSRVLVLSRAIFPGEDVNVAALVGACWLFPVLI